MVAHLDHLVQCKYVEIQLNAKSCQFSCLKGGIFLMFYPYTLLCALSGDAYLKPLLKLLILLHLLNERFKIKIKKQEEAK